MVRHCYCLFTATKTDLSAKISTLIAIRGPAYYSLPLSEALPPNIVHSIQPTSSLIIIN